MNQSARELIVMIVNESSGITLVDLATQLSILAQSRGTATMVPSLFWFKEIEEAVKRGDIVEIEFVLPQMNYRAKSFYLPRGAKVRVINAEKLEK